MARGLGESFGERTEFDPNRSVTRAAMPQALASKLHYEDKITAADLLIMPEPQWVALSKGGMVDRAAVAQYLRAYEHYQ